MLLPALAGLTAGVTHALSGPDHLAAVLPLASEAPDRGARIGLSWGAGHGLGTVGLCVLALLVRLGLDLETTGLHAEALVGVVLVLTGAWTLARRGHTPRPAAGPGAALGIGTLHGVAGGTHVVVAITALALPTASSIGWLVAFILGAGGAMGAVGWVLERLGARLSPGGLDRARTGAGLLAIGVGLAWTGHQLLG